MANDEVLGPRKTMFVLVIVVGCFAVLWPRILSPLILGYSRDQLKPNDFDREAGCCEVLFDTEITALELINEVCTNAVGVAMSNPYTAQRCRMAVNDTCGLDITSFLQRKENVGKSAKMLLDSMKRSNGSCLQENFGVPSWFLNSHQTVNTWIAQDSVKQERPPIRMVPHPALRERGRAIPPGAPTPPSRVPVTLPPLARVQKSPLSMYYELDVEPPPIPGMRPPLGSPGGPIAAPKSSMGFVMPIYTICIIVFFVYTLSKILFKRSGSIPYESIPPDPQFQRRVFRDEPRSACDNRLVVTAISGLVAEVQQQMEANYAHNDHRQNMQDITQPYSNGSVHRERTPIPIITTEFKDLKEEKEVEMTNEEIADAKYKSDKPNGTVPSQKEQPITEDLDKKHTANDISFTEDFHKVAENIQDLEDSNDVKTANLVTDVDFLEDALVKAATDDLPTNDQEKTLELSKESASEDEDVEVENSTVKVMGMELTAHTADGGTWPQEEPRPMTPLALHKNTHESDEVKSIFLETDIPHQSRVLVADFEDHSENRTPTKHSPLVVSGKMTLSLIQDAPRDTPERELESTMDEFTTASAMTHNIEDREDSEEEVEVEEIEEEVEYEEEEEKVKS